MNDCAEDSEHDAAVQNHRACRPGLPGHGSRQGRIPKPMHGIATQPSKPPRARRVSEDCTSDPAFTALPTNSSKESPMDATIAPIHARDRPRLLFTEWPPVYQILHPVALRRSRSLSRAAAQRSHKGTRRQWSQTALRNPPADFQAQPTVNWRSLVPMCSGIALF
jgi:hypothetical protein